MSVSGCVRDAWMHLLTLDTFAVTPASVTPGLSTMPPPGIPEEARRAWSIPPTPPRVIAGKLEDLIQDFDANTEAPSSSARKK